jgi:catalase
MEPILTDASKGNDLMLATTLGRRLFRIALGSIGALTLALAVACRNSPGDRPGASEKARPSAEVPKQEANLPQQIADQLVLLAGGIHPGFRFMHAKGIVLTGSFTPARGASSVSRAAHLRGGAVPVTVRFSDGTGVPNIPDTDPRAGPRGMSIRFTLPGGAFTDIVAISHNGFVVGTGEDFLAFLKAIAATRPDSPHPSPVEAFLGSHPRALKFVVDNKPLPRSFANLAYFGNNAFVFVDTKGTKHTGRYQIIPVAGLASLDSASAAKAGPNYLFDDLSRRLARGPVRFRLYAQLANPGDQTNDGSIVWPDDRKRVELGTISLTKIAPNNEELQRSLTFNPTFLTDGIQLSDDALVPLRSAVYALSVAHRR